MLERTEKRVREVAIEKPSCEFAVRRGWMVVKLMLCNIDSMPDRLLMRKGRVIFIEFKAPGEDPTPKQAKRHREIRAQGIEVFVIDNLEDAQVVLQ